MMLLIRHKLSVKDFSIDWIAAAFGLAMTSLRANWPFAARL